MLLNKVLIRRKYEDVKNCGECAYFSDCEGHNWEFCPYTGNTVRVMR